MDRTTLLEHTVTILQKELRDTQREVNAVLGEISGVLQAFTNGNRMALEVFDMRLKKLEKLAGISEPLEPETREGGVEL